MFAGDREFEDEVRRIARLLWPAAEYDGAAIKDGRERDGFFETDEFIQIVECTVSRSKQKALEDFEKLQKLIRRTEARHPTKFVKGWFVTLNEPTADQRGVFNKAKGRIVAVSFDQFRSKLIDARSYLGLREGYPFGSVRDPQTGSAQTTFEYVPLDILDEEGELYTIESLCGSLLKGERFVLLGDYGAGKSATVSELHRRLGMDFRSSNSLVFPVTLNLRDHHGQTDPVEALERHARRLGFIAPEGLVRAWRAGLVVLLLDGFDEIATAGWAGKTKRLRDLRYRSMELVRGFLRETPSPSGILMAGRAHFFDSPKEMVSALALDTRFKFLNLSEFNERQVTDYLAKAGWKEGIPDWIPSRPLLLGYLAARGLLQQTLEIEAGSGPAVGWNSLLDRICAREAEIEAGIDAGTVRRLIEYIATVARASADGLGPLSPDQITGAFSKICGYPPDDRGSVLLQRLPGVGGHSSEDGARVFIDRDFAEVARGGAVFEFIESPYTQEIDPEPWQTTVSLLGAEVAALRCHQAGFSNGKLLAALQHAHERFKCDTPCADVFLVLERMGFSYDGPDLFIKEVLVPEIVLEQPSGDYNRVEFQDSIFGRLDLSPEATATQLPRFVRCHFGLVEGFTGYRDLPGAAFSEVTVDAFENPAHTTNAILSLLLPLGTRVLLTILRKLYAQRGSGRRESALYRGLDVRARQLVPQILNLLRREGFATRNRQGDQVVWLPTKSSDSRRRALSILSAPSSSPDPLMKQSRELD